MNKWIAALLSISSILMFLPIKLPKEMDEFHGILEILRYACVAWIVVVVLQQYAKGEFVRTAPTIAAHTIVEMRDEAQNGTLLEPKIGLMPRISQISEQYSYLVHPTDDSDAIVVPLPAVVRRASETAAREVEGNLFVFGGFILIAAVLMRLLGIIVRIVKPAT